MATRASRDRKTAWALGLAVLSLLPLGSAFVPYLVQEISTLAVLGLVGLLPAVIAFALGISAFEGRRRAEEPPWPAAVAVSVAALAMLGGALSLVALGAGGR
jgi:hypothetical protein